MTTLDTSLDFDSTSLPLPIVNWNGALGANVTSSRAIAGLYESRSNHPTNFPEMRIEWRLDGTEAETLETFYNTTCGNGVRAFKLDLKFPKRTAETEWLVRFTSPLSVSTLSQKRYSFKTSVQLIARTTVNARALLAEDGIGDVQDSMESYSTPYLVPASPALDGGTGWEKEWVVTYL